MGHQDISVVIPVGPNPAYLQYLPECLESIVDENPGGEIVIVDDMANLPYNLRKDYLTPTNYYGRWQQIKNDWLLGCAASWNIGVARASHEWVLLMGSDDYLLPGCIKACLETISDPNHDPLGYYNLTCIDSDGEVHNLHNNAAIVSKSLWRFTGGFGPSAFAAPDAWLISILLGNAPQHLHQIKEGTPLYFVRKHPAQDTPRMAGLFWEEVISIRNKETARFSPNPEWTKWAHS